MRETSLTLPEVGMLAATRVALGAGLGLLLADHLSNSQRRAVAWTLVLVGVVSTIPLASEVLGGLRSPEPEERWEPAMSGSQY